MTLFLKSRNDNFCATAAYENGVMTIEPGSKINLTFAEHIRGGRTSMKYRDERTFVDAEGNVLKSCAFNSPSTAAQFVTGTSRNGYLVWKDENKSTLRELLKEQEAESM